MTTHAHSDRSTGLKRAVAVVALVVATLLMMLAARSARADLLAAYAQGYGGVSNSEPNGGTTSDPSLAIGVQAGARIFGLELYGDYTSLDRNAAIERAILGLRLGFQLTEPTRLELRGGGGVIAEQGGALTGPLGALDRAGFVARVGVNLERKLVPMLFIGAGVNAEVFTLAPGDTAVAAVNTGWQKGMDVLGSLHLKFEIGI